VAILSEAGVVIEQRTLRPAPVERNDLLVLALSAAGAISTQTPLSDVDQAFALLSLGVIQLDASAQLGTGEVDVDTEVFDDHDPNESLDAGRLPTGVLLGSEPEGQAGRMPGRGLSVLRNDEAVEGGAKAVSQSQRGWLPPPGRSQVNRASGLGSNGHRRATASPLAYPVARALLARIGDRVSQLDTNGPPIERVTVGVQIGIVSQR